MRGHGRTQVCGEPKGYDVKTIGADIVALADALEMRHFHLLGHSTGGMAAVRYAMDAGDRLLSLLLLGTSSATALGPEDERIRQQARNAFAELYERRTWTEIFTHLRHTPGPLLYSMNRLPERKRLWQILEAISRRNEPEKLAAFVRAFFVDPDPRKEALRRISCPTLVLIGAQDKLFLQPSQTMARHIPRAQCSLLKGVGHMTAIEAPELTSREVLTFLKAL
jgi:pimeloyl-ACP methyl ester carboxylesterase